MTKPILLVAGLTAAGALAVAPTAQAATARPHTTPSSIWQLLSPGSPLDGTGKGDIGSYPEWSTVNCDGTEEWVFVDGGANPTDKSQCK
jgi:hypothetical protein